MHSVRRRSAQDANGGGGAGGGSAGGGGDAAASVTAREESRPVFAPDAREGLEKALGFKVTWVEPGMLRPTKRPDGDLPPVQPLAVRLFLAYQRDHKDAFLPDLDSDELLNMMGKMVRAGHRTLWGATEDGDYVVRLQGCSNQQKLMIFLDLLSVVLSTPRTTLEGMWDDSLFITLESVLSLLRERGCCHLNRGAMPTLGALAWRGEGDRRHAMPDLVGFQAGTEASARWHVFPAQPLPRRRDGEMVWDVQWGEGSGELVPECNHYMSYFGMLYATGVRHHVSFDPHSRHTLAQRLGLKGRTSATETVYKVSCRPLLTKAGKPPIVQINIKMCEDGAVELNFMSARGKLEHTTYYHQRKEGDAPFVDGSTGDTWREIEQYTNSMKDEERVIGDPRAPHASNCIEGKNQSAAFLIRQAMRRSIDASRSDALPSSAPAFALWALKKIQEHSARVGIKLDLTKQWMNLAMAAYAYLPDAKRPAKAEWMQTLWALQVVATSVSGATSLRQAMERLLGNEAEAGKLKATSDSPWFALFEESLALEGEASRRGAAGLMEGFEQTVCDLMAAASGYEHDRECLGPEVSEVYQSVLDERSLQDLLPTCYRAVARAAPSTAEHPTQMPRMRDLGGGAGGGSAGGGGDAAASVTAREESHPVFAPDAREGLEEALGFKPRWVVPGMARPILERAGYKQPAIQPLAVQLFLVYRRDHARMGLPELGDPTFLEMMGRLVQQGHHNLWGAVGRTAYRPGPEGKQRKTERHLMTFLDLLSVVLSTPSWSIDSFAHVGDGDATTTLQGFVGFLHANGCHVTHAAMPTLGALPWRGAMDPCHAMPDLVGFRVGRRERPQWRIFPAQPLRRQRDGKTVWDVQWGEGEPLVEASNHLTSYLGMLYATGVKYHVSFASRDDDGYTFQRRLELASSEVERLAPRPTRTCSIPLGTEVLAKTGGSSVSKVTVVDKEGEGLFGLELQFLSAEGVLLHTTQYAGFVQGDSPFVSSERGETAWGKMGKLMERISDEVGLIKDPSDPLASNCSQGQNRSAALLIRQAMRRSIDDLGGSDGAMDAPRLALWALQKIQEHSKRVGIRLDLTKQGMNLAVAAYTYLPAEKRPAKAEWMQTLWALQVVATSVSGATSLRQAMERLLGNEAEAGKLTHVQSSRFLALFQESLAFEGGGSRRDAAGLMEGFEQTVRGLMAAAWRYEHDGELASAGVAEVYRSVLGERSLKDLLPTCYQDAAARAAASSAATAAEGMPTRESDEPLWRAADGGGGRGASEPERGAGVRASGHPVELAGMDEDGRMSTDGQGGVATEPLPVVQVGKAGETPRVLQHSDEVHVDDEQCSKRDAGGEDQPHGKPGQSSLRWVGPSVAGVGVATVLSALVLYRTQAVLSMPISAVHGVFFGGVALMVLGAMAHLLLRHSGAQGLLKVANGRDVAAPSAGGAGLSRTLQPPSALPQVAASRPAGARDQVAHLQPPCSEA